MNKILKLDTSGQPREWLTHEDAIVCHAKGQVIWSLGEDEATVRFRGGHNRDTGLLTTITTAPIIAVRGKTFSRAGATPSLTNQHLFRRDHCLCAYCGKQFTESVLTREHIVPTSRGGHDVWMNVVTACKKCNHKKDDRLLEEIGWQLLYVPYTPNYAEKMILENRNVLACQMDYLKAFISEHSRVWQTLQMH